MKKLLFAIALLMAASTAPADAQAKHRHQHKDAVETTSKTDDDEALEAVSDTTDQSFDANDADDDTATVGDSYDSDADDPATVTLDPSHYKDPFTWFNGLWLAGVGGILIALFVLLVMLLFIALPIILLIWFLRYLMKRSETKAEMQRMAMQNGYAAQQPGQTGAQTMARSEVEYDEFLWRKGVRNVSIGIGLLFLFGFMGADSLMGVGLLVACLGGGQMYMARTTGKKSRLNKNDDSIGGESTQSGQ